MTRIKHLYVHVPFCKTICFYCDFCHRIYNEELVSKWLLTLENEVKEKCHDQYETIYIGGGTPTSLSFAQLQKLLDILKPYSNNVIEYTLEANPENIDEDKIKLLKKYNVNRISLGVQSTDDYLLKTINRKHTFDDVKNVVHLLKDNNITNISVDLMYSLPKQTMDILNKTIDDVLQLDVPHISAYSLTIEDETVFGKKGVKTLDEDIEADMFETLINRLTKNGYVQYEVSNFCKNGYESIHNLGYWNYDDFLGLSLSSSSKIGNKRWTNTKSFDLYFNNYNCKDEDIVLSKDEQMFENIMMSLRLKNGLNIEVFNKKYDENFLNKYKKGISNKYIRINGNRVYCSNLNILNSVLLDFM